MLMTNLQTRLDGWNELAKAATPAPWHTVKSESNGDDLISVDSEFRHITLHMIEDEEDIVNAKLIASVHDILADLNALNEQNKALREALQDIAGIKLTEPFDCYKSCHDENNARYAVETAREALVKTALEGDGE